MEKAVLKAAHYLTEEIESGRKPEVWVKPDHTLVMNLDLECQRLVLEELSRDTRIPIVAEEDEASHELIKAGGSFYLVDPLDGTTSCRRFLGEKGGQVGYGPLLGYVEDNTLVAASFFSAPHGRLFTAVKGEGAYEQEVAAGNRRNASARRKLCVTACKALSDAGVLFYLGTQGEARVMQLMRNENAIENMYRFGGFANDCCRLARGSEQISVQFAVKPWDFSAVLISSEAGLEVWLDPLKRRIPLKEWKIEMNNPVVISHPDLSKELFELLGRLPQP